MGENYFSILACDRLPSTPLFLFLSMTPFPWDSLFESEALEKGQFSIARVM